MKEKAPARGILRKLCITSKHVYRRGYPVGRPGYARCVTFFPNLFTLSPKCSRLSGARHRLAPTGRNQYLKFSSSCLFPIASIDISAIPRNPPTKRPIKKVNTIVPPQLFHWMYYLHFHEKPI